MALHRHERRLGRAHLCRGQTRLRSQDKIERAAAEQSFLSRKLDLDDAFAQDTDYASAPQRYAAALRQAADETTAGLAGAAQRADFHASAMRFAATSAAQMAQQAAAKWQAQGRENTVDAVNQGVDDALRAPDEATRAALFAALHDRIDGAATQGWLSPDAAAALRKSVPQIYAAKRCQAMLSADPAATFQALLPSALGADGMPRFDKSGDWRDYLAPAQRIDLLRQSLAEVARRALIEQQTQRDAVEQAGGGYVTQMVADPAKVDPSAIANDANLSPIHKAALSNMLLAALQRDGDRATQSYGPGFYGAFQAVNAPDGSAQKLIDPTQLYPRASANGDLTAAGVARLTAEIRAKRTPEGEAESAMKSAFLAKARGDITASNDALYISDPKGDALFLKFLAQALPAFDDGKQAGKTAVQLLDPDSPDYIGKAIATFQRTPAARAADMLNDAPPAPPPIDLNSKDGILAAHRAGRLDRRSAAAALIMGGFARPPGPPAPAPQAPAEPASAAPTAPAAPTGP